MAWNSQKYLLPFLSVLLLFLISGPRGFTVSARKHRAPKILFVFGDSYADTGNLNPSPMTSSWNEPYGMTFPGKPSGRFSDGRVFTDYLARHLALDQSPVTYRVWKSSSKGKVKVKQGMNFAYGGSGIFKTLFSTLPNMTTQIDFFENIISEKVYKIKDLRSSLALVSVAVNDYTAYRARNGTVEGLKPFIESMVKQMSINIKRIQKLGVVKIIVDGLQPVSCLPSSTANNSFTRCDQSLNNMLVNYHNTLLSDTIRKYNEENEASNLLFLDLYNPFSQIVNGSKLPGKVETLLRRPCCQGLTRGDSCGSVDSNGNKRYTVCHNPSSSFFWDSVHPTQAGWNAVYNLLFDTLQKFIPIY